MNGARRAHLKAWLPLAALANGLAGAPAHGAGTVRYLALGDSYTIGEGVSPGGRWPVQLARRAGARGLPVAETVIVARTGWTTAQLLRASAHLEARGRFDLVTLLIGVNDQFRGRPLDDYRADLRALLERAARLARAGAAGVVAVSIPDYGYTPAGVRHRQAISAGIDVFNAVLAEACRLAGVTLVDVTALSRSRPTDAGWVAADGLHPSAAQYAAWVEVIAPVAIGVLGAPVR